MVCKNCGATLASRTVFCTHCGAKVEVETQQPYADAPVTEQIFETQIEQPAVDPGKTKGTLALVFGIIAIAGGAICSCLFACLGGFVPLIFGILGIVFGIMGSNASKAAGFENKSAKIGMILSIVGIAVIILFIIANAILGAIIQSGGFGDVYY